MLGFTPFDVENVSVLIKPYCATLVFQMVFVEVKTATNHRNLLQTAKSHYLKYNTRDGLKFVGKYDIITSRNSD